ncbi:odorant receptor 46a-like isoform X3 [Ceratina calcarata]|uniref:Odorant receptor n=1 Tax=Ceratina calcarata TaxID=156304 RepID=A0AAJ7S8P2_9HYME|nr:odorant receptor 46a-like isoform X3 [Ceratina calcarata]
MTLLTTNTRNKNLFQENTNASAFELPFYKTLGKYMTLIGVNPFQNNKVSLARVIPLVIFIMSGFGPMYIRMWETLYKKDFDRFFEDAPQALTALLSTVKLLNVFSNKMRFKYLFNYIIRGRQLMKSSLEMNVLDQITNEGTTLATIYRNEMEYFWPVFVHLSFVAVATVIIIITIDSLYIVIIHHACGMFAACGHLVQNATEDTVERKGGIIDDHGYKEYNRCINVHYEALQFYDVLDVCCRNSYLIQMGINMMLVSVTAVELVIFFDRPADVIRLISYLAAQLFHLYMISLPGQRLLEQSLAVTDKVWFSRWYEIPVRAQKMLVLMILRANKPCVLTAAGLYQMTIESFGITVKACMSYFAMFLSVRE